MVSDRFRLRYKLTPEHYQTFSGLAEKRLKKLGFWKSFLMVLPIGILIGLIVGLVKRTPYLSQYEARIFFIGMAISVVLVFLLYLVLRYVMKGRPLVDKQDAIIGEFKLAAYEGGGVQVSGVYMQSSYDWTAFTDLTQGSGLLVLWIGRTAGVILPNSAFSDGGEKQEFVDFVRERIAAQKPGDDVMGER